MSSAERYAREKAAAVRQGTTPYGRRVARGQRQGLTKTQSMGKPRPGEPSIAEIRRAARQPAEASLDALRAAAVVNGISRLGVNPWPLQGTVAAIDDRATLAQMATIDAETWRLLASVQTPNNPFWYH